ncbi:MAG: ferritin-like domain-containing protein [Pseudomonadota bacterium]|nr:ferritin-like domain-containing protein [Pseudomonadota bacterium]
MHTDPTSLRLRFLAILGALPLAACGGERFESEACISVADPTAECPTVAEAAADLVGVGCGTAIVSVDGEGVFTGADEDTGFAGDRCCYPVTRKEVNNGCVVGRPYYEGGQLVMAPAVRTSGWAGGRRPSVAGLSAEERRVLADAWTQDALIEHASVAAFARFALELMAFGAPAELVDAAFAAGRDEVRHARLTFALAEAYAGAPVAPAAFPFGGAIPLERDLAALAAATAREGCIGETVVALLAAEALAATEDPAAREVLAVIAADETRHAELAWKAVRWMIEAGDERVRAAVAAVFEDVAQNGVTPPDVTFGAPDGVLAAHGRIRPEAMRSMVDRALAEVVAPCGLAATRKAA